MVSVDTFSGDFYDSGIPPIIGGAEQVSREHRVDYLGDTHGNYEGFLSNMKKLWLINARGNWRGGDRILVMLGDIYGDRNHGSIQTALHIEKLISQGAHIEMICWNHDEVVVDYFDDVHNPDHSIRKNLISYWLEGSRITNEITGLQEFVQFIKRGTPQMWIHIVNKSSPGTILTRMRGLKRWAKVLTNMCRFQIGKIIDDTLFIHTDPVDRMYDVFDIYDWDMESINAVFRGYLVQTLLKWEAPSPALFRDAMEIRQTFLSTANRRINNKTWQPLLSSGYAHEFRTRFGINRIIHGHSNHKWAQTMTLWGLEITSADNWSFKWGDYEPWNTYISAGSILTSGHRIAPKM